MLVWYPPTNLASWHHGRCTRPRDRILVTSAGNRIERRFVALIPTAEGIARSAFSWRPHAQSARPSTTVGHQVGKPEEIPNHARIQARSSTRRVLLVFGRFACRTDSAPNERNDHGAELEFRHTFDHPRDSECLGEDAGGLMRHQLDAQAWLRQPRYRGPIESAYPAAPQATLILNRRPSILNRRCLPPRWAAAPSSYRAARWRRWRP